jgi:serine/threonine protein kinase
MLIDAGSNIGPFRVIEPLGRGGMASVYKAYEAALDRHVALKVLPAEFLHEPDFADRFRREAKLVAKLEHPNIVPIYAHGIDDGVPWMAMRLVAGGTLAALLKSGPLEPARAVAILTSVAAALDYAHSRKVLHRDVKPQNVLLDESGHVYLADFGIARMVEGSTVMTKTGLITGTPQYMAPEQARAEKLDQRCDVYALGIVAYEMLTGRVPFAADTPVAVLMKQVTDPVPIPPQHQVPEAALRSLLKALSKKVTDRWPSCTSFMQALGQGLQRAMPASTPGASQTTVPVAQPKREITVPPSETPPIRADTPVPTQATAETRTHRGARSVLYLTAVGLAAAAVWIVLVVLAPMLSHRDDWRVPSPPPAVSVPDRNVPQPKVTARAEAAPAATRSWAAATRTPSPDSPAIAAPTVRVQPGFEKNPNAPTPPTTPQSGEAQETTVVFSGRLSTPVGDNAPIPHTFLVHDQGSRMRVELQVSQPHVSVCASLHYLYGGLGYFFGQVCNSDSGDAPGALSGTLTVDCAIEGNPPDSTFTHGTTGSCFSWDPRLPTGPWRLQVTAGLLRGGPMEFPLVTYTIVVNHP